jgi:hypothetical protein
MSAATCKIQHYLKTPNTVDSGNFILNILKSPNFQRAKYSLSLIDPRSIE